MHLALRQDHDRPPTMPTLKSLHGSLITLGDGSRVLSTTEDLQRDLELAADTCDLILSLSDLPPQNLGTISLRLVSPLMLALHQALDAATSADVVDLADLLAEVARAEAMR